MFATTLERSNDIEFYQAFTFDGANIMPNDYAVPEVELIDGELEISPQQNWIPMQGYSGQHGYSGPIMHESEQFSPNLLQDMHKQFGPHSIYGLAVVESYNEEFDEYDAAGWIILVWERD